MAPSLFSRVYSTRAAQGATTVSAASIPLNADSPKGTSSDEPQPPTLLNLESRELIQLLPQLKALAQAAVVVQCSTAATRDHSAVLALRGSGLAFVYSSNDEQAHSNTLVAARIAAAGKGVVHFGEFTENKLDLGAEFGVSAEWIVARDSSTEENGATNGTTHKSSFATAINTVYATLPNALKAAPYSYSGSSNPETLVVALGDVASLSAALPSSFALLSISLYRPLSATQIRELVPTSVKTVVTLEQVYTHTSRWLPLFLDIVGAFAEAEDDVEVPTVLSGTLGQVQDASAAVKAIEGEHECLSSSFFVQLADTRCTDAVAAGTNPFSIGNVPSVDSSSSVASTSAVKVPKHESTYTNLLAEVFGDRLWLANAPSSLLPGKSSNISSTSPEYALGHVLGAEKKREELRQRVREALAAPGIDDATAKALTAWLQDDRAVKTVRAASDAAASIESLQSADLKRKSNWIIGSEAWSHDLGASGLHHALSTGADVNLLLIDTTPYSLPGDGPQAAQRRKDAGLYAMTYGNAYVASVAVYGDFSQTLRAFAEADAFKGPSVILAYLPGGEHDSTRALEVLKATKKAIEIGTWPLYRWDPSADARGAEVFELDSEKIKADLRLFLDRQNHLTELSNRLPSFGEALEGSSANRMVAAQKKKAKDAFEALSGALEGPPLLVLYASDGGNAEKLAKKFATRARTRGVAARTLAFDDMPIEDLPLETNVVFITSVAGQGEFPQNGRELWKALQAGRVPDLANIKFSAFGLGDSHYWPRKEDAHYYNKPVKDLHKAITALNAQEFVPMGLGDDQDPDGPQTAYKVWEPAMWKALGVDAVETNEPELEPITNEHIKIASNYLRGTIKEGLEDKSTGALAESDGQLTKFHGIYQQDDRDIREERKAAGLEPAYSFMVRMRLPAGVCEPNQWLAVDEISDRRGNNTFKLTTRQTFQFHGIVKANLKPAMQEINKMLLDTIAACGDVNRTVVSITVRASRSLLTDACLPSDVLCQPLPRPAARDCLCFRPTVVRRAQASDLRLRRDLARQEANCRRGCQGRRANVWRVLPAAQVQDRNRRSANKRHGCLLPRSRLHCNFGR